MGLIERLASKSVRESTEDPYYASASDMVVARSSQREPSTDTDSHQRHTVGLGQRRTARRSRTTRSIAGGLWRSRSDCRRRARGWMATPDDCLAHS